MNSSYVDTAGITEFIYPNNLTLTLDSGACSNAASKYHYLLKTDGFPAKPGTNEILGCILSSALEQKAERQDYSLETTVYTGNNYIKIDSVCLPQYTLKDIKDIKNTLLHVNLSQENFENAKALTKKRFLSAVSSVDSKKDVLLNKDEYLYTGNVPLYIPVQEAMALYDKITLDDVKQLYNHLLTTSSASAVFSVSPELTAGKNKELLLSSIGSQLPVFKPHKEVVQTDKSDRTVSMPARAHVIKRLSKENYAAVSLNYKIPLTKDLRENLGIKILETIIGGESYSRLFTQLRDRDSLVYNANSLLEEQYLTYSNLVLVTKVLVNEGNFDNLKKVCNCFKENIQNLRTLPVKEAELNTAKLTVKSYIANAMEIPATRHYYLSKFGLQGIQKAYNLIDNLTAADIRALADKYLKNGVWCIDAPKEAYEYNNEYLNCLENEII